MDHWNFLAFCKKRLKALQIDCKQLSPLGSTTSPARGLIGWGGYAGALSFKGLIFSLGGSSGFSNIVPVYERA